MFINYHRCPMLRSTIQHLVEEMSGGMIGAYEKYLAETKGTDDILARSQNRALQLWFDVKFLGNLMPPSKEQVSMLASYTGLHTKDCPLARNNKIWLSGKQIFMQICPTDNKNIAFLLVFNILDTLKSFGN
jgi:hypothetical protein